MLCCLHTGYGVSKCLVYPYYSFHVYKRLSTWGFFFLFSSAPPYVPFPIIEECEHNQRRYTTNGTCLISLSISNITCSASGYYPSISLSVWHGDVQVDNAMHMEWNNTDGTKNKSVTALAVASDDPFVCMASDIPGWEDDMTQQTVSVFLFEITDGSTTDYVTFQTTHASPSTNVTSVIIST